MANNTPFISRFQRNTQITKNLELALPGTQLYEETKNDFIIPPNINKQYLPTKTIDQKLPKISNDENSFLDIGLHLDCIGGSRANAFHLVPFGYKNTGKIAYHHIFSLKHKTIITAYGDNPYDFSSALADLTNYNTGKDYNVHSVAFNENTANMVHNDFNPTYAKNRRYAHKPTYKIRELHYPQGISFYLERLQLLRETIKMKIMIYNNLVSTGRKTKYIFIFLDNNDCNLIRNDKRTRENFEDIIENGYKEKIILIPCVKELNQLPENIVTKADMIMAYGDKNTRLLENYPVKNNIPFEIEEEYNEYKTVGLIFDIAVKPHFTPLDGFTQEFYEVKKELEEWEKEEEKKYFQFLDSLDDGSKYDNQQTTPHKVFTRKDNLIKEINTIRKTQPIITFS